MLLSVRANAFMCTEAHSPRRMRFGCALLLALLIVNLVSPLRAMAEDRNTAPATATIDPRDDLSPWGAASGSEWFSAFPRFNPMLADAGVKWLRGFYEWQTIQPKEGYWNWALPDRLVANARANNIHLTGVFAYFAPWASADGGTRKFPIKDIRFWRNYVNGMVTRYHGDIKYWEIWNEFNGSFAENGTPQMYADLVREASISAKKVDPTAKIGMSVANFDVGFLDAAIKAGAANYFDYICVHPYERLNALADDGEVGFLSMATTLRQMLAANNQPADIPLWITEIGATAPIRPNQLADKAQAVLLAKAYLLAIASGFQRVFWFEPRGPSYGGQADHGLIRPDFSLRPSYQALNVMTRTLGSQPTSIGWLNLNDGGYGFVFGTTGGAVLAAWTPVSRGIKLSFTSDVHVSDLEGHQTPLSAGQQLSLTNTPILITNIPAALVKQAQANKDKPYPWGGDHAKAKIVTALLGDKITENGLKQINPDTTTATTGADGTWQRTNFTKPNSEGHYVYFLVDPQFAPLGTKNLEITAVVRRMASDKTAGMSLNYESPKGYVGSDYFNIPQDEKWHELTWRITDANFAGGWGWNFRLNGVASPNEFLVKEVRVRKLAN